jgi:hypothetical protein
MATCRPTRTGESLRNRFDVVDAPEQFDRVLLIIDFPGGAWTPSHALGGYLYATVTRCCRAPKSARPRHTHSTGLLP